jgi:hypothetical protein
VVGADFRAAFVASCFLGAFPPVDLRAVCLVRAMITLCSNGDDRRHEERKDLVTKNEVQRKQKGTGKSTTKCGNTRASERVYNSAGDEDNDKQNKDDNKTELKQHRLDPVCLQLRCPGINGPDSPHQ